MAMDDIRDLKARNAELAAATAGGPIRAGTAGAAAPPADSGGDWETQKRRLLAELESDDQHDAESTERRLKIEEIVARTDKIIAEKNREIEELQHLLNNQSNSLGSLALGAAALEQVLDQDAIIREERQRLQQLQDECQDKLRQAEIELAMERARLARRDAEIEEKIRNADAAPLVGRGRGRGPGADRPAGPRPLADAVGPDRRRPAGVRSQPRPAVRESWRTRQMCKHARIGVKLALGLGLVAVVLAAVCVLSIVLFGALDHHVADLTNPSLAATTHSAELQARRLRGDPIRCEADFRGHHAVRHPPCFGRGLDRHARHPPQVPGGFPSRRSSKCRRRRNDRRQRRIEPFPRDRPGRRFGRA